MAETLLPAFKLATAPRGGSCTAAAVQGGAARHYEQLFKSEVSLVDGAGRRWAAVGALCCVLLSIVWVHAKHAWCDLPRPDQLSPPPPPRPPGGKSCTRACSATCSATCG
jgi:hypothetical protein